MIPPDLPKHAMRHPCPLYVGVLPPKVLGGQEESQASSLPLVFFADFVGALA
jgi:hypothetical protein